ncbi:hypothetical protein U0070_010821, partial [Myodes glareolus]
DRKKCLQKYSIVSNNCYFRYDEGVRSGGHPYSLQPLRPRRLSTQKDLEQKEKLHVEMKTKIWATFVVTSEILPFIKWNFLLKINQKRQKALLRSLSFYVLCFRTSPDFALRKIRDDEAELKLRHKDKDQLQKRKRKAIGEGRNPWPCTRHCVPHFNTINPPKKMVTNSKNSVAENLSGSAVQALSADHLEEGQGVAGIGKD